MPKRFIPTSGMTLMELMMAAGIVAIALVLLLGSLISIFKVSTLAEDRTVAESQANTIFEQIASRNLASLKSYIPPVFSDLGVTQTVDVDVFTQNPVTVADPHPANNPNPPAHPNPTTNFLRLPSAAGTAIPNPVMICCTVTWTDKQGRLSHLHVSRLFYF